MKKRLLIALSTVGLIAVLLGPGASPAYATALNAVITAPTTVTQVPVGGTVDISVQFQEDHVCGSYFSNIYIGGTAAPLVQQENEYVPGVDIPNICDGPLRTHNFTHTLTIPATAATGFYSVDLYVDETYFGSRCCGDWAPTRVALIEVVPAGTPWYRDSDNDGYGDPSVSTVAATAPTGYVADNTDANDADGTVYPGAPELCDGKDNDQNATVDDGWPDSDSDGEADCVDTDDDADGIPDDQDPDVVAESVAALPVTSFGSGGQQKAMLDRLTLAESLIAAGDSDAAIDELNALRKRVDGCGTKADKNDWIVDCGDQIAVRQLIDALILALETA